MIPISGHTRFVLMLGDPVTQVKTPAAFAEWAAEQSRDAVMIPVSVSPADLAGTISAMRGWKNCCGAVITYPHKQAVVAALDEASDAVSLLASCNVIRREPDGRLVGDLTDGTGFVRALDRNGFDPAGRDAHVVGAGGAGSAIAFALLCAGVRRLLLTDSLPQRAENLRAQLVRRFPGSSVLTALPPGFSCSLICNATPVGMGGAPGFPAPLDGLADDCVVADIVPDPPVTAWLLEARRRGHVVQTGPEMVLAQLPAIVAHLFQGKAA